jgi:endonuclease III related protein
MPPSRQLTPEAFVRTMYRTLARAWGAQHWWPAETAFEVIAGAILTQNTSWTNVERALASLRAAGKLNLEGIRTLPIGELEQLVRSSGYYRQKAQRLKAIVAYIDERYGGSPQRMFLASTAQLRAELLSLNGVGPETADSILLYAAHHEIFVVDAYTRRVLERHAIMRPSAKYDEIRTLFERALRREKQPSSAGRAAKNGPTAHAPSPASLAERSRLAQVYNEMHGLLVQVGKHYCFRVEPNCRECPLGIFLPR